MKHRTRNLALVAVCALLAGCASNGKPSAEPSATPHGYVEGAEESAEPQWRLVLADGSGKLWLLNPVTEKPAELATVDGLAGMATDGRYVFAESESTVNIIDSGVWTVPHGDHRHYYHAEPKDVGEFDAGSGLTVVGDPVVSILNSAEGVTVLDRAALDEGEVKQRTELSAAAALPYAEKLLAAGKDGTVEVLDRDGERQSTLDEPCRNPRTPAVTTHGGVFGCEDGALLITETDGKLKSEKVDYPDGVRGDITGGFDHRPGAPLLAAKTEAGDGIVLDVKKRKWSVLDTTGAVAVSALGEDFPVLALTEDGKLRAFDPGTGEQTASNTIMEPVAGGEAVPVIQADSERAYVNDPADSAVHEIDYQDKLRVARSFDLDAAPAHLVETGW
ncbi:MAG: hypothetical protein ACRD0P_11165 [Stackebrandtia sp.]